MRPDGRTSGQGRSVDNGLTPAEGPENAAPGYGYGSGVSDPSGDHALGFVHYLQIIYKRRYIAASAFLVVVLGGALSTFTATRIYEGTVSVLIEREGLNVVGFQEVMNQSEIFDDYYETQYQLLQSRALARRTIDALDIWDHPAFHQPPRITIRSIVTWPLGFVAELLEPPAPMVIEVLDSTGSVIATSAFISAVAGVTLATAATVAATASALTAVSSVTGLAAVLGTTATRAATFAAAAAGVAGVVVPEDVLTASPSE